MPYHYYFFNQEGRRRRPPPPVRKVSSLLWLFLCCWCCWWVGGSSAFSVGKVLSSSRTSSFSSAVRIPVPMVTTRLYNHDEDDFPSPGMKRNAPSSSSSTTTTTITTGIEKKKENDAKRTLRRPTTTLTKTSKTRKRKRRIYKHLFRHYDDISFDSWLRCCDPQDFLKSVGYFTTSATDNDNVDEQQQQQQQQLVSSYDVHDHLAPKIRFLVEAMRVGTGRLAWLTTNDGDNNSKSNNNDGPIISDDHHDRQQEVQVQDDKEKEEECVLRDDANSDADEESHHHQHSMRLDPVVRKLLPNDFFEPTVISLDRTLGPYHAYLAATGLPHGRDLLLLPENTKLWMELLEACRRPDTFPEMCQRWRKNNNHHHEKKTKVVEENKNNNVQDVLHAATTTATTAEDDEEEYEKIQRFLDQFTPGLIPASKRRRYYYDSSSNGKEEEDDTTFMMMILPLLLQHGANAFETDSAQGASPLHWAAGQGNQPGVQALLESMWRERVDGAETSTTTARIDENSLFEILDETRDYRHGATPFHWACGSVRSDFETSGTMGAYEVCRDLLQNAGERRTELANLPATLMSSGGYYGSSSSSSSSAGGTTPIMWASWAGNLPLVELLILHGGDPWAAKDPKTNQTALHWAAGAGHVSVCEYLLSAMLSSSTPSSVNSAENDTGQTTARNMTQDYHPEEQASILLVQAADTDGKSPLDYAQLNGHQKVIDWIIERTTRTTDDLGTSTSSRTTTREKQDEKGHLLASGRVLSKTIMSSSVERRNDHGDHHRLSA